MTPKNNSAAKFIIKNSFQKKEINTILLITNILFLTL